MSTGDPQTHLQPDERRHLARTGLFALLLAATQLGLLIVSAVRRPPGLDLWSVARTGAAILLSSLFAFLLVRSGLALRAVARSPDASIEDLGSGYQWMGRYLKSTVISVLVLLAGLLVFFCIGSAMR
jgi:hypothetical protein